MGKTTINGKQVWHEGNQGAGSGMNADTIDGSHKSQIVSGDTAPSAPSMTWTSGKVTRIDYADGSHKTLTYSPAGALTTVDVVTPGEATLRKTFAYDPSTGALSGVTHSTI